MTITTVTSRELNQNVAYAKKAAMSGPVFIRGSTAGAEGSAGPACRGSGAATVDRICIDRADVAARERRGRGTVNKLGHQVPAARGLEDKCCR